MKKLLLILSILMFSFIGCESDGGGGESNTAPAKLVTIQGKAEKGPLQKGAIIQAAQWHPVNGYSGAVFVSATINNQGGYTLEGSTISGILDVSADGFFINENTGTVSNSRIVLSGLIDSNAQTEGNINIITHIIKLRVFNLIKNYGKTFAEANNQAVTELFSRFGWTGENPLNTSIATNPRLLLLSAALCKDKTVDQVSDILTILTADMEDGTVDVSMLDEGFYNVDCAQVEANIFAMYGVAPSLSSVKDEVIAFRSIVGPPPVIRIVDPIPAGGFYWFTTGGQLSRFVSGQLEPITMLVTIRQDGEDDIFQTFNCIDFFKIDDTFYFSANVDGSGRNYSQINGVVAEIESLPAKPTATRIEFNDGIYNIRINDYEGQPVSDVYRVSGNAFCGRNVMVSGYWYGFNNSYDASGAFIDVQDGLPGVRDAGLYFIKDGFTSQGKIADSGRMWK